MKFSGTLKKAKATFLDNEKNPSFNEAQVALLGVAVDLTASYCKGTCNGPKALIDASYQIEYELPVFGKSLTEFVKIHNAGILAYPKVSGKKVCKAMDGMVADVQNFSKNALEHGKLLALFGGEHSIPNGAFKAMSEIYSPKTVTVLQFDAHLDLRKEYDCQRFSHASIMRNARELGFNAIQVGIRDHIGAEEIEYIKEASIENWIYYCPTMPEQYYENELKDCAWINEENVLWKCRPSKHQLGKICKQIQTPYLYITFDVDALDASEMPGTGTPLPHGLSLQSAEEMLYTVISYCKKNKIKLLGFDINEVSPITGSTQSEQKAALLAYKILAWNFLEKFKE
ncbi:MAG: arginase family protein [Candidatus Diapherotrites archaeon]|nr:arginase family protein [Candidatus Diapherotrites archaeon]